ncbi:MAG: hypothetical protein QRY72_02440 [Candidatus Rhabdochlamydia sp.]
MGLFKTFFLTVLFSLSPLIGTQKEQIRYLLNQREFHQAFDLYLTYKQQVKRHDFELLTELGTTLLEQGAQSQVLALELSSLYGLNIAQITPSTAILESLLNTPHLQTKLTALSLLAKMYHDKADELLTKCTTSSIPLIALESVRHLAEKKHPKAAAYLEALMHKFPPEFSVYFPPLFALINSPEAVGQLKKLLYSSSLNTRVETLLCLAKSHHDDLLPHIRPYLTHLSHQEQEAAALAVALLKDSSSLSQLHHLSKSHFASVELTSLYALYLLGSSSSLSSIKQIADQGDLFAITLMGSLPSSGSTLKNLQVHSHLSVRLNATLSLLLQKDSACLKTVPEFLFRDHKDLGFIPITSAGKALYAWKVISSASLQESNMAMAIQNMSLSLREQMLKMAVELEEQDFLWIASQLFQHQQIELIPLLSYLLENHKTEGALNLLKQHSEVGNLPLIRMYCHLALFRLKEKGPYADYLKEWIHQTLLTDMMHFNPLASSLLPATSFPSYELSPSENGVLLMQSYEAIAQRHSEEGIDLLLQGIHKGHPNNRYALAGLLLHTLQ